MMDILGDIQNWYRSNCDGEWERSYGVRIDTLDNPGWSVKIDLEGTNLEGRAFEKVGGATGNDDWISCRVVENTFEGYADPSKLQTVLSVFLNWARSENGSWLERPGREEGEV